MTLDEMKQMKESRGYSLARLAAYSGVPLGTIQKIFSGQTQTPRKATLDAIERVLQGDENQYSGQAFTYEMRGRTQTGSNLEVHESSRYGGKQNSADSALEIHENSRYGGTEARRQKKQGEYTLEDYYAIPEEQRVELIDGVFYDMTAPKAVHQSIIGIFHIQIADYIRKNQGPCTVWLSPFDVQLDCDNRTMVEPDLIILCSRDKLRSFGLCGAPDFALEVLSEATRKKDLFLKAAKYQAAGVREYWIVDPRNRRLIVYNYMDEDVIPQVLPIAGKKGLAIYDGKLEIDLDEIAQTIEECDQLKDIED